MGQAPTRDGRVARALFEPELFECILDISWDIDSGVRLWISWV